MNINASECVGQDLPVLKGPNVSIMIVKPKTRYTMGTCEKKGLISILIYDLMKI